MPGPGSELTQQAVKADDDQVRGHDVVSSLGMTNMKMQATRATIGW
jgi:hypothetical protein